LSSKGFVYKKFSEFYERFSGEIPLPSSFQQREFAFLLFKQRIMVRHKNFADMGDLKSLLTEFVPSDVYHSCAYYECPDAEMDRKGWLGADLVFDIDADHIPTPCNKIHDEWTCSSCGFSGKGITPENCPVCGGQRFDVKTWPCVLCLNSAKEETIKLLDMLLQDFGFSERELHVFFSGHRGYHVHVENEAAKTLDAVARKEIVDYVTGLGLELFDDLKKENWRRRYTPQGSDACDFGWSKRIKLGMRNFILNADEEELRKAEVKRNLNVVLQKREALLERCLDAGRWGGVKGVSVGTWRKIAEHVASLQSARIDTVVTTDVHRLIRMAGTLHGKTGFRKVEFPVSAVGDFDPFKEAVVFRGGCVKTFVFDAPEFRLGDEVFGPFRGQEVELPVAATVLLVCKDRAEVKE